MQYLYRKNFSHRIQFQTMKIWFLWRKIVKIYFFLWKSMLTCCLQLQNFHIWAKKFENWVDLCSGKVLNFIVTKREIILWNHLEMVNGYLQWWLLVPPSSLIRVKTLRLLLKIFSEPVNLTKFFTHFCVKLTFLPIFETKGFFHPVQNFKNIFLNFFGTWKFDWVFNPNLGCEKMLFHILYETLRIFLKISFFTTN